MDDRDFETVESVDENGRHVTRIVHHQPPATDMTLIGTDELNELRAKLDRTREERDHAIAHDRQPYPTQWAYDQACAALVTHRARADTAEAEVARLRAGESPEPPSESCTRPTPAELIHLWNAEPELRLERARQIIANGEAADRCLLENHEGAVAELRQLRAVVARVRAIKPSPGISQVSSYQRGQDDGWDQALAEVHAALNRPLPPDPADGRACDWGRDSSPSIGWRWTIAGYWLPVCEQHTGGPKAEQAGAYIPDTAEVWQEGDGRG